MAFFEIQWRASTKKDLRAIPPHEVERIVAAVEKLSDEPFPYGFQKLTGAAHTYRIRIGDYRVVYEVLVESKIVEIARVRHRKDVLSDRRAYRKRRICCLAQPVGRQR